MNNRKLLIFASFLLLAGCTTDPDTDNNAGGGTSAQTPSAKIVNTSADAAAETLLVYFNDRAVETIESTAAATRTAATRSGVASVDDVLSRLEIVSLERLFTYDELNRISTYEEYDYTDNKRMLDWSDSYSYSGNTITCLEKVEDQNQIFEYKTIYKLDEEQNVKTWTCEYNEIGKPEIDQGELSYENGYFSSSRTEVSNSGPTTDQAIWVDGNLVKAGETDEPRATTNIEYSHIPNNSNVDFNYLLSQTEWLDCLAFEESGIKAFGCFGKRSAYLMSKEKDGYNNDEHVFEYRTDNEGNIREITVTTYDGQHQVSSKRIHTISYIDAN